MTVDRTLAGPVPTDDPDPLTGTTEDSRATTLRWVAVAGAATASFIVVTVLVTLHALDGLDGAVRRAALLLRTPWLTAVETVVTDLGSFRLVVVEAAALAALITWWSRRLLPGVLLLAAVASTTSIEYLLKLSIGRLRPPAELALGASAGDYSFPSGHTTSGSTVAGLGAVLVAAHLTNRLTRRLVVALGVVVAIAIGLSRVYLGYHWFSDVLGGWLLAAALTALVVAAVEATARDERRPGARGVADPPSDPAAQWVPAGGSVTNR